MESGTSSRNYQQRNPKKPTYQEKKPIPKEEDERVVGEEEIRSEEEEEVRILRYNRARMAPWNKEKQKLSLRAVQVFTGKDAEDFKAIRKYIRKLYPGAWWRPEASLSDAPVYKSYSRERVAVISEAALGAMNVTELHRLMNYTSIISIHDGFVKWKPKTLLIITSKKVIEWFPSCRSEAVYSRIDLFINWAKKAPVPVKSNGHVSPNKVDEVD